MNAAGKEPSSCDVSVHLREPVTRDRGPLASVLASTGFFSAAEIGVALEVFDEAVQGKASGYEHLVAESAGRVTGYVCWGGPIEMTISSFDLYWIAVDAAARGGGIGHRLLAAAESRAAAAGCAQLFVETSGRDQYAPTHRFYESCGYLRTAELPDFYAPGDAKVFYVKRLTGLDGPPRD